MTAQSLTAIASVVVAVAALLFAIISFHLQQVRAEEQQHRSEKLATESVKPLLWIQGRDYVDMQSIQLRNYGLGPAIIKLASFEKDGIKTSKIVDLFAHLSCDWETFADLPPNRVIPSQGDISLFRQSLESLQNQNIDEEAGRELLRRIRSYKKGIKVHIEYLDIFEHEMKSVDTVLS